MIVIMAAPGFLGNRTWVQANVLALAAEAQIPVVHPAFELFPYFKEEGIPKLISVLKTTRPRAPLLCRIEVAVSLTKSTRVN